MAANGKSEMHLKKCLKMVEVCRTFEMVKVSRTCKNIFKWGK